MANWFLISRDSAGMPTVFAMNGGETVNILSSRLKSELVGFFESFSAAQTFLVEDPDADTVGGAVELLPQRELGRGETSPPITTGTWFYFARDRGGQPITLAMQGSNPVEVYRGNLKYALILFLQRHAGANTFQVAPSAVSFPNIHVWQPPPPTSHSRHRVMLEIGHGPNTPFDPGAIAHDGSTTEHSLNTVAANAAKNVIAAAGVHCTVIDTTGTLTEIGMQASGFDVFCSIHHNAFNGAVQRSEVFSHTTKGDSLDSELARLISLELSNTLNIPNAGSKRARFGVLSGAENTNVRASVLAETYFIDFQGNGALPKPNLTDYSTRGGEAIGRGILQWLQRHP